MIHSDSIEILDVQGWSWGRFRKFWCRANRWKTIDKLKSLYQDIHDLSMKLIHGHSNNNGTRRSTNEPTKDDLIKIRRLRDEIEIGLKGLDNLMLTYREDRSAVAEFEALKDNYQVALDNLKAATVSDRSLSSSSSTSSDDSDSE